MKKITWKLFPGLFNFQWILYKKESDEVSILFWTNFDSFAIKYLIKVDCFKTSILQLKWYFIICKHKKGLKLVFGLQFLLKFLMKLSILEYDINRPNFISRLFTSKVIQENAFFVLCLGIWWRHEIWKPKILKFEKFLRTKRAFEVEYKTFFLVWQVLLFRIIN